MTQAVDEPVDVICLAQSSPLSFTPQKVQWQHQVYAITKIGLHHTIYKGTTLCHIYSVMSDSLFMRLSFNTKNLMWKLEEISDGLVE